MKAIVCHKYGSPDVLVLQRKVALLRKVDYYYEK